MSSLVSRLLHMAGVARVTVVDDTGAVQKLQVRGGTGSDGAPGVTDGVLRPTQFGFTSSPPVGSDVVLFRLWGNRTLCFCIATNHQASRLKGLMAGDTALYDVRGAKVLLGPGGIVIDGAGLPLTIQNVGGVINAPTTILKCQDVQTGVGVDLNTHTHTEVSSGVAVSGPPST